MKNIAFKESQRFANPFIWGVVILLNVLWLIGLYYQVYLGHPIGNHPMSDLGLFLFGLIPVILLLFIWRSRFVFRLTAKGVYYQYKGLQWKESFIAWQDIQHLELVNYKALGDYGGWGIRMGLGSDKGIAYIVSGNTGLKIFYKDNKIVLLGSNKVSLLEKELRKVHEGLNNSEDWFKNSL